MDEWLVGDAHNLIAVSLANQNQTINWLKCFPIIILVFSSVCAIVLLPHVHPDINKKKTDVQTALT